MTKCISYCFVIIIPENKVLFTFSSPCIKTRTVPTAYALFKTYIHLLPPTEICDRSVWWENFKKVTVYGRYGKVCVKYLSDPVNILSDPYSLQFRKIISNVQFIILFWSESHTAYHPSIHFSSLAGRRDLQINGLADKWFAEHNLSPFMQCCGSGFTPFPRIRILFTDPDSELLNVFSIPYT